MRGRGTRSGAVVLSLATCALLGAPPTAGAATRPTGPLALASGSYFGAFENPDRTDTVAGSEAEVTRFESDLGRKIDIDNRFYSWSQQIPTAAEAWDVANGRIPMVTWGAQDTLQLQAGTYDTFIRAQADRLRDLGGPVFLRFYHEMDGDYRQSIVHSAADYIAAWRHVHDLFGQEGATNVVWVWCPTAWKFINKSPWPPDYYPGDAYVDWIAADGYNWYPAPNTRWRTFTQVFGAFYDWAVTMPKPIMLAEIGVQEDPNDPNRKAAWLADAHSQLENAFDQVQAAVYFDTTITKGGNTYVWNLTSSSQAFSAWRDMGQDPYFDQLFDPDTQPPTIPGQPSGSSNAPGQISLSWAASTDDVASTITYRVYRDGGPTPVGSVSSSSTTTVGFTDTGLAPSSMHTYQVDASDGVNASALSPVSDQITVMAAPPSIFTEDFSSGFGAWSPVRNLTLDPTTGGVLPPSAHAAPSGVAAFARRSLGASYSSACLSEAVNLASIGTSAVQLLKLRAGTTNVARLVVTPARMLRVRNDVTASFLNTNRSLATGWHTVELCVAVGASGSLSASLDGSPIGSWTGQNLGTASLTQAQILDDTKKTFTANVDDVTATA